MAEDIKLMDSGGPDTGKCRHFNGISQKRCEAGECYMERRVEHDPIRYRHRRLVRGGHPRIEPTVYSVGASFPCSPSMNLSGLAACPKYEPKTPEEIAAREAENARMMDLMRRGLSSCCEAPIDERHVIREGPHKGHGPRYCSKCGRCVFMV